MTGYQHLRTLALTPTATVAAAAARDAGPRSTIRSVDDILPAGTASWWASSPDGAPAAWARSSVEKTDGSGVAIGPSADRPIDTRGRTGAAPAYTGLRVVVGSGT